MTAPPSLVQLERGQKTSVELLTLAAALQLFGGPDEIDCNLGERALRRVG
jgi:hypothetical protein